MWRGWRGREEGVEGSDEDIDGGGVEGSDEDGGGMRMEEEWRDGGGDGGWGCTGSKRRDGMQLP